MRTNKAKQRSKELHKYYDRANATRDYSCPTCHTNLAYDLVILRYELIECAICKTRFLVSEASFDD